MSDEVVIGAAAITDHDARRIWAEDEGERSRALADAKCSALRAARLNFEGAGMSTAALVVLSGISRETLRKARVTGSPVALCVLTAYQEAAAAR